MRKLVWEIGCIIFLAAQPAPGADRGAEYVATRRPVIQVDAAAASFQQASVWLSSDLGRTWSEQAPQRGGESALRLDLPSDGRFGVYLVLQNAAGASAEPPVPGSTPHLTLIADTVPPTLQLHSAFPVFGEAGGAPTLRLRITLIEEHMAEGTLRIFYRDGDGRSWSDGGLLQYADGVAQWRPPAELTGRTVLLVTATDRAGNRATAELTVDLGALSARDEPAQTGPPEPAPASAPADPPKPNSPAIDATPPDPRSLRAAALARQYLEEGRVSLAAARLNDAVQWSPTRADLRVELGAALLRLGDTRQASQQFEAALQIREDFVPALEGAALADAMRGQWPAAALRLRRAVELAPHSGDTWLRLGDVLFQLGQREDALQAWSKAAEVSSADSPLRGQAQERRARFEASIRLSGVP